MSPDSHTPRGSSRVIIAKIDELSIEADEAGFPIMCIALQALARVSRLDLPDHICRKLAHGCIMSAEAVIDTLALVKRRRES